MALERGKLCPLIKKDCVQLACAWFTQIRGRHPQTGAEVDEWGCAVTWLPLLIIDGTQQTRQAGAAVESFRNETVKVMRAVSAPRPGTFILEDNDAR
jgi:hypothetical protein